jgi:beta-fructofuranosidase
LRSRGELTILSVVALSLDDKWIWDFWLVESVARHHVFYLQAPKSIGDPGLRHWNVSIGHAVSDDLVDWEVLPDAIGPGEPGAWDDLSTWTGSIIEHRGTWHLFYTGTSSRESGLVQRIGLATSKDLTTWHRCGQGPLIEADSRWYEKLDSGMWHDEAWRDPWVFRHTDGGFHATITARSNRGRVEGRGVVAHARSDDLHNWEVLPPITISGGFGQLEVSQLMAYRDDWYLVFCSDIETQTPQRRSTGPGTGTYYLRASDPLGPYRLTEARPLAADRQGSTYAGRLVDRGDAGVFLLTWERIGDDGRFRGVIADPVRVERLASGELQLAELS